jgi:outer membrane protein OmpU
MKNLMLSAAVAALALAAAPAMAQDESGVKLNLGGQFKGYVNYTNQDDGDLTTAGDQDVRSFDILRDTEIHFGGETTLDNGLTVGAQIEARADAGDSFELDETYAYFSGTWGRVNFGDEDGAAYLLQVAAPSADENIDGIRNFINPLTGFSAIDYANDGLNGTSGNSDKITYLTPVFSGFQAGLSYTPTDETTSRGNNGNSLTAGTNLEDIMEVAARYEGEFSGVGFAAGAGYTTGSQETDTAANDDFKEWNVGLDANIGAFGLGAVYTENNNAANGGNTATTGDTNETWVVGADYTTGAYKLGASYLNNEEDFGADTETDRYAVGAQYSYGPGMSFRGTVSYTEVDGTTDTDGTAVTVGTQINF